MILIAVFSIAGLVFWLCLIFSDIQKAPAAISVQAECHSAVDDGDDDLSCDDDHELNIDQVFTNTAAAV